MKVGNQIPTNSVILPYAETYGGEAVLLYNLSGYTCHEWQELMLNDILGVNSEGLWTHTKFGYSVPRRNGKNEVLTQREIWGLFNGELILHTAHLTDTAHKAYERLENRLLNIGVKLVKNYKALGQEVIEILGGGRIEFRTRTNSGALGSGYDLLIIDEAQEYTTQQQTALNYVVTSSTAKTGPQTIMCGTPPTAVSGGTVFRNLRDKCFAGEQVNGGWAEWSVDHKTDVKDRAAWYQCNPSLGTQISERAIQDEINGDDIDFNIQRLGLWIKYNQASAISEPQWLDLKADPLPELAGSLCAGIKYGKNGENVVLALASKTNDGRIYCEAIDCRNQRDGNSWITQFIQGAGVKKILVDGAAGTETFLRECKELKIKGAVAATTKEVIQANAEFETMIANKVLCHSAQPALTQSVTNCQHRAIGSGGGYGYKTLDDAIEVALLEAVSLATYAATSVKETRVQRVGY